MSWLPSRFWISVPENLLQLSQEEQLAWIWIAGQIKTTGKAPTNRAIRQLTGWGGGRASRFLDLVRSWEPAGTEPGQNRDRTGTRSGQDRDSQPARKADNQTEPGQDRDKIGTRSGQDRDRTGTEEPKKAPTEPTYEAPKTDRLKTDPDSLSREQYRAVVGKVGERLAKALWYEKIRTVEDIAKTEDRALRFCKGVGESGLRRIRDVIPYAGGEKPANNIKKRESLWND